MNGIQGSSAVVTLSIDTSGLNPILLTTYSTVTNTGGAPAQLLTDPKGLRLYVGSSRGQNDLQVGGAEVYSVTVKNTVRRLAWSGALTAILFCSLIDVTGCGSSSSGSSPVATAPAQPPIITPSGTSTITITMTAMSLTGQPLQLQPFLLTLTVK